MLHTLLALAPALLQTPAVPTVRVEDPPGPFGYDLLLPRGEILLRYSWDGTAPVPFVNGDRELRVPFGERGLRSGARLYLPGNSSREPALTGASVLESKDLVASSGRFGDGVGFGPTSLLRLALPAQDARANGWTLAFWLKPGGGAFGRPLLRLPGALEIRLQNNGRVGAKLLPSGADLVHPSALPAGEWSFVALAYDPLLTREARLFVDGVTELALLPAASPERIASELQLGDLARNAQGFAGVVDELFLEALPLSTAKVEDAWRRPLRPGSHDLELVTTRGVRTVEPAAVRTRELVLDDAADFALGQLVGVEILNGALAWAAGRWRELAPRGAPPPRTAHPTVHLGGGRLLTYGGEVRDTHLGRMVNTDDTWLYDPLANAWRRVITTTAPPPRCHIPLAYSPDHDLVLLVGGWRNDMSPSLNYDDTWVFHVRERRWERRWPSGDPVGIGSAYGLVYLPALQRFLLLRSTSNMLYDPVADSWTRLPAASAVTESGQPTTYQVGTSPMCALDAGSGRVVVFGGAYGQTTTTFSDTTALYDPLANRFTVADARVRPPARVRGGFAYDSRRKHFVLFGGVRDQYSVRNEDLWLFDPRRLRWMPAACSDRPSPRGGFYGMAYDELGDRFLLFGGRHSPERWLDETWELELGDTVPGVALYTFDLLEHRNRRGWFADTTTPADSAVRFLFRAGDSGADWGAWNPSTSRLRPARYLQVAAFLDPGSRGEVPFIVRMGLR